MPTSTAIIGTEKYKTSVQVGSHAFLSDEPEAHGGTDAGPAPGDLLRSALATCTAITLRMYADRKGWPLESLTVEVDYEKAENGTLFRVQITCDGNLDEVQRQRLAQIANACPVHKILAGEVGFETAIL